MKYFNKILFLMCSTFGFSFVLQPRNHFFKHTINSYSNGYSNGQKESSVPLTNTKQCNCVFKKTYTQINDENIDYFEIKNTVKKNTDAIIFFTGANSIIPSNIYSDFFTTLCSEKYSVYVAVNNIEVVEELSEYLLNEYKSVSVVSHSTGAINAIDLCNLNHQIKKLILLDPVDNRFISKTFPFKKPKKKDLKLKFVDSVLFLNAKKSYTWSFKFPQFPFIPSFKIDETNLITPKKQFIEAQNFGHCDILNKQFSDIMHNTLSRGFTDRDTELYSYYEWLSTIINTFLTKSNLEWDMKINSKIYNNVEYNIKNVTEYSN